jgi:hypothetical protein
VFSALQVHSLLSLPSASAQEPLDALGGVRVVELLQEGNEEGVEAPVVAGSDRQREGDQQGEQAKRLPTDLGGQE